MQCEKCRAAIDINDAACPSCGELILQNVDGFENTKYVECQLKKILETCGKRIILNDLRFSAAINDFIPDLGKERNLLKNVISAGVLRKMIKESTPEMAIMKAKSQMINELFLSGNAVEFIIVCFAYMLNVPYISPLRIKENESSESKKTPSNQEKSVTMPFSVEDKILTHGEALKYILSMNINIPDGYTKIDNFCFDKFSFMKAIRIPSTVFVIGEYAFSECRRLKSVYLPDTIKVIKRGAFSQCSKLISINIPNGVLEIDDDTFSFCQELETIEIPSSVGSIGSSAFLGCEKLRKLILPDSVKYIGKDAFTYCANLKIYCYENSYVHKYCLANNIEAVTASAGKELSKL